MVGGLKFENTALENAYKHQHKMCRHDGGWVCVLTVLGLPHPAAEGVVSEAVGEELGGLALVHQGRVHVAHKDLHVLDGVGPAGRYSKGQVVTPEGDPETHLV